MMRVKRRLSFDVTFEGCAREPSADELKAVSVDFDDFEYVVMTRGKVTIGNGCELRIEELEEAITEVSLQLCESKTPEAVAAMRVFGKVMDEAARKRMGI